MNKVLLVVIVQEATCFDIKRSLKCLIKFFYCRLALFILSHSYESRTYAS